METPESAITQSYIQEEAQEILKIAFAKREDDGEMTRVQLMEIAAELGISPQELTLAEQEWKVRHQESQEKQIFDTYRRQKLQQNLTRYAIFGTFFLLINLVTTHGIAFALSILLFWGLFLSLKAWRTFQTEGDAYEQALKRWRLKQQVGQSLSAITDHVNQKWQT
ncbi:MAG: 2TM domain-containing protein [Oscillatoriales cyanobacterium RM2_1_1]|nr:2TM domain-containing protein [Oscillatoriales cyanobacterium SM2_3_0]NJO47325.1 2TM domain-containing protein [Oscillatoriales cyanobacterium RM2_1_1]